MNARHLAVAIVLLVGCPAKNNGTPTPVPSAKPSPTVGTVDVPQHCSQVRIEVPAGLLEREIGVVAGAGPIHQVVTTGSETAQRFYDQGLGMLISYAWIDAGRSFHQALRLDPSLAMAHRGLADAWFGLGYPEQARVHLERATALAATSGATDLEKQWIEAAAQRLEANYATGSEQATLFRRYRQTLESMATAHPEDPDIQVALGVAQEPVPWGRGQSGGRKAGEYYQRALGLNPDHPGALHFQAHTHENLGEHEKAAERAARYAAIASAMPHAHHMQAHSLPRLGKWPAARDALRKADALHRDWARELGVPPGTNWHFGHNLMILGIVEHRLGNDAPAATLLEEAFELDHLAFYEGVYDGPWLSYLLVKRRWDDALTAASVAEESTSSSARLIGAVTAGQAHLGKKDVEAAETALARAEKHYAALQGEMKGSAYAAFGGYFEFHYLQVLRHQLTLRSNSEAGAAGLLRYGDAIVASQGIDGWAEGLLTLRRLSQDAESIQRNELRDGLDRRIRLIDPKHPL